MTEPQERESTAPPMPVVRAAEELDVPWDTLQTIIGGASIIDTPRLHIERDVDAYLFLHAHGFDLHQDDDVAALEFVHRKALEYLTTVLLPFNGVNELPERYRQSSIPELLREASKAEPHGWPNWPCVILKLCHCAAHALWSHDATAHDVALRTIRERVEPRLYEQDGRLWIGDSNCSIPLIEYHIKEQKSFARTMTKLLHKPGNFAADVHDRLGVRFVTYDVFSAVLLVKFLRSRHIISYANNRPELARNSLADIRSVRELYERARPTVEKQSAAAPGLETVAPDANPASSPDFKMIRFVERLLVKTPRGRRTFFPYEIQILDRTTWEAMQSGESSHDAYEQRQLTRVRRRVFGAPPGE